MSFAHPWVLLLLAIPIALGFWEWYRRGFQVVVPFDHANVPQRNTLRRWVQVMNLLAPALLAVALLILAGPTRLAPPQQERELTNIQFVMDVSGSMSAPFGTGTRADTAIASFQEFTLHRKGDAFGLTVFGTEVLHWIPLTRDLSAIRLAAPFLRPEKMPPYMGGTRIGKALREVRTLLVDRPEGDRMIVLISDGQSFDLSGGVAEHIGQELATDRVTVFYIHVGEDPPSNEVFALASATGGSAFIAGDPESLRDIFKRIDQMKPIRLKPGQPESIDFFQPFAVAGLALLALQTLASFGLRYTPW